jgi:hypothetical protein
MKPAPFDLGLCAADLDALREASRSGFPLDREAAFRLVAQASARVDAAVRRRALFSGAPFELPDPGEARPGRTDPKRSEFRDRS